MRLRKSKAKRAWREFNERALEPLTYGEIMLATNISSLSDRDVAELMTGVFDLIGDDEYGRAMVRWWMDVSAAKARAQPPSEAPDPPEEPKGLWEKARGQGGKAGAYLLLMLSYARNQREIQWLST